MGRFTVRKIIAAILFIYTIIPPFMDICAPSHAAELTLRNTPVKVFFSPKGGCTEAIIAEIDRAKTEILIQAYSFTSAPIAKALLNAHKRGVKVEAVLDKSQRRERYTSATFLSNAGIPTYIDDRHAIAHNKVMIIDGGIVITGSFNFTKAAEEKNAENLLIIRSGELAELYRKNWTLHRNHSVDYRGPGSD
jgi:phosphatidylserine/phosphatidylglycerophosphate/cardiolipin synthase-like enzyme